MTPAESQVEALLLRDRALRALARVLLADAHAAEDVAQEAWLAALQHGEGALSLPRWLSGVVRNVAGKRRRSEERRTRREHHSARPEVEPSTAEILERESVRARVVAAVLALEEPYRATIVLRYLEDLPPRAIAKRQGLPVETVRTRTKRALELLRLRLDAEFGGERRAWCALLAPLAGAGPRAPHERMAETLAHVLTVTFMSTQAKVAGALAGAAVIAVLLWNERGTVLSGPENPAPAPEVALAALEKEVPAELTMPAGPTERAPRPAEIPPAPVAVAAQLGSVLVRVLWYDERPAEGVVVMVEPEWVVEGPTPRTRYGVTDEEGMARFEGLPPGLAWVTLDRDAADVAEIEAGHEAEVTLAIPRGFDVAGVVLDPLGSPVADAGIWVSRQLQIEKGLVLARTDEHGRFALRSLGPGYIGARAAGHAPSLCQTLLAGEGAELALELVLMGPGGAVEGTVRDPEGRPLANAWVAAGLDHPLGRVRMVPLGGDEEVAGVLSGPLETRTDAEGRYRIDGLAPGSRRMAVRVAGFGPWRGTVEVLERSSRRQDVRLEPGVTLVGRILADDGQPAGGLVEVGESPGMLRWFTSPDEDGRFRLEDLEAGEIVVQARCGRQGDARAQLSGRAGETLVWEARLVRGGSIRGRVVDERGAPLAGLSLRVEDEPEVSADPDLDFAATDAEGRFAFEDMHDRPHRVAVFSSSDVGAILSAAGVQFPVAVAHGARPGGEELLLVVESAQQPSASIVGRVVDELGAAVDGAQLVLRKEELGNGQLAYPDPSGAFELGPLPPGTWVLAIVAPELAELPPVVLGPRALAPDEVWDCGTVVLARGGTVLVVPRELAPGAEPSFTVLREGAFPGPLRRDGLTWRSGPLQAGAYRLQVRGRGVAAEQLPFAIVDGETTRLDVALETGQAVVIRIRVPDGGETTQVRLRVRDESGEQVLEDQPWLVPDAEGNVRLGEHGTEVALTPGSYQVETWLEDGRRAAAELRVEAGKPRELVLEPR